MKLSVKNRINFGTLYPQEGNLVTQVLLRDIIEKVHLTQEDIKKFGVEVRGPNVIWDEKKAQDKEVPFTEAELSFLKEQVERLDKENKINQDILELCLMIREPQ